MGTKATVQRWARLSARERAAAQRLHSSLSRVLGRSDWALTLWDSTTVGGADPPFRVTFRTPAAVDRLLGGLPERAFGRAYVEGLIDIEPLDDFLAGMSLAQPADLLSAWPQAVSGLIGLGGRPRLSAVAGVEAHLEGRLHSRARDAAAIRHHYDLPPEFFALFLDDALTYSCAYFSSPDDDLDSAQRAKLDLVCRKLRLREGETMLDIGCGWGSLVMHAAETYGVEATGITLSPAQARYAQQRIRERGLEGRAHVRLADYRDETGTYDAVASVGMVEHVGASRLPTFSTAIHGALRPGGRALIHGITKRPNDRWIRSSFIGTFVFPDGELEDIGLMVREYERAGLEVRDVESLREHYALTARAWKDRLDARWDEAVRIAGIGRARVWRLYMTGSAVSFRLGTLSIHQTLAVRPGPGGASGVPLQRADWY